MNIKKFDKLNIDKTAAKIKLSITSRNIWSGKTMTNHQKLSISSLFPLSNFAPYGS